MLALPEPLSLGFHLVYGGLFVGSEIDCGFLRCKWNLCALAGAPYVLSAEDVERANSIVFTNINTVYFNSGNILLT